MDPAQELGSLLNRNKPRLARNVAERLAAHPHVRGQAERDLHADLAREDLFPYIELYIGKLFLSVISERPELFENHVVWQRVMYEQRALPAAAVREHLIVLGDVLAEELPPRLLPLAFRYLETGLGALDGHGGPEDSHLPEEDPHRMCAARYLELLRDHEHDAAYKYVTGLREDPGLSVPDIYLRVLVPVQKELGRLWQLNQISESEEHAGTETTRRIMAQLSEDEIARVDEQKEWTVLTFCAGSELHDVGIRMVSDFLRFAGYRVIYAGANTPITSVLRYVEERGADALAISAVLPNSLWTVKELIDAVRDHPRHKDLPILVGGYVFNQSPNLWKQMHADACGSSAEDAVQKLNALVEARKPIA